MYSDSFSYSLQRSLIYECRLQWVCVQHWCQTHTIRNTCLIQKPTHVTFITWEIICTNINDSRHEWLETFITIYSVSCCCCIYKKKKKKKEKTNQKAVQTHNHLVSILWCFFIYENMCTLFQKMQCCVCFLKMFRPLKGWYVYSK